MAAVVNRMTGGPGNVVHNQMCLLAGIEQAAPYPSVNGTGISVNVLLSQINTTKIEKKLKKTQRNLS